MPRVFRAMKKDEDGLPSVEQSATGLGIRPEGDVDLDLEGSVILNGKGMSVAPEWRSLPLHRIPKRLRDQVRGARGTATAYCFRSGDGPFESGAFAPELTLITDSATHGCLVPVQSIPVALSTRKTWPQLVPPGKSMRAKRDDPTTY